jgi:O-antigen/teichoic acid export membrane protein
VKEPMMSSTDTKLDNASRSGNFTMRAAWITGANILSFILATATPFILVHILTQAQMGVYRQSIQIMLTATAMINLQVASSAYYFIPKRPEKRFQIALNIILFYVLVGSLIALAFWIFPEWSALISKSNEITRHIPLIGLIILCWVVGYNMEVLPLALGDARTSAGFIVLAQIIRSVLTIGSAIIFRSERAIIWSVLIQCLFQMALGFWYLHRHYRPWRYELSRENWDLFKAQMLNALPYGVGGIIYIFQNDLHTYIVAGNFPASVYAIYSIGCFQVPLLSMLTGAFTSVMIPELAQLAAKGDSQGIIQIWSGAVRKLALVFVPICSLLFVVRNEFYAMLFPPEYASAASIFAVFLISLLMTILVPGAVLRAFNDLRFYQFKLYSSLALAGLVLLNLGVRWGGLVGIIVTVICLQAFDVCVTLRVVTRRLGFGRRNWRDLAPLGRTALAGLLATVLTMCIKFLLPHEWLMHTISQPRLYAACTLALCGIFYLAAYLTSVIALGAITSTEVHDLRPLFARVRPFVPGPIFRSAAKWISHRGGLAFETKG